MEGSQQPLEPLKPGQMVTVHAKPTIGGLRRIVANLLRPNGFSVGTREIRL
jgi:hypothetical protein